MYSGAIERHVEPSHHEAMTGAEPPLASLRSDADYRGRPITVVAHGRGSITLASGDTYVSC